MIIIYQVILKGLVITCNPIPFMQKSRQRVITAKEGWKKVRRTAMPSSLKHRVVKMKGRETRSLTTVEVLLSLYRRLDTRISTRLTLAANT